MERKAYSKNMDNQRHEEDWGWWKAVCYVLDRPLFWFIFVLVLGLIMVEESYNETASIIVLIFAVIIWEYERKKRGK